MGNGPAHDFVYEPLARVPGLLVLHDLVLHHARGADVPRLARSARLRRAIPPTRRARDGGARRVIGRVCGGGRVLLSRAGGAAWSKPTSAPWATSCPTRIRCSACPSKPRAPWPCTTTSWRGAIEEEVPGADVVRIPMPMRAAARRAARRSAALRRRHGVAADDFVVGTLRPRSPARSGSTPSRARWRAPPRIHPGVRLLVVGPVRGPRRARRAAGRAWAWPRAPIVTGRVPFSELAAHIELADAVAHLRYPTARETSAALLRVLAQGRPTIMADLEHLADVPERRRRPCRRLRRGGRDDARDPEAGRVARAARATGPRRPRVRGARARARAHRRGLRPRDRARRVPSRSFSTRARLAAALGRARRRVAPRGRWGRVSGGAGVSRGRVPRERNDCTQFEYNDPLVTASP